jgi:hypothetical protein
VLASPSRRPIFNATYLKDICVLRPHKVITLRAVCGKRLAAKRKPIVCCGRRKSVASNEFSFKVKGTDYVGVGDPFTSLTDYVGKKEAAEAAKGKYSMRI